MKGGPFAYARGMAKFAILRTQKLKAAVAVHRSAKHTYREQDTPNAAADKAQDNTHIGPQSVQELMDAFNERKPAKHRKDAVQCVEVLVTASPEAMNAKSREAQDAYLNDALGWIKEKFGEANVIGATIHRDEATCPHLAAYVVPVDPESGRLNCKKWLGGSRALSEMQTDFAEKVAKRHDLERGIEGSKAKHQRVKAFYGALEQPPVQHATITAEDLTPRTYKPQGFAEKLGISKRVETPEAVAQRVTKAVRQKYDPAIQTAAQARQWREKAEQAQATAKSMRDRLKPVVEALAKLTRDNQTKFGQVVQALAGKFLDGQRAKEQERQAERARNRPKDRGPSLGR